MMTQPCHFHSVSGKAFRKLRLSICIKVYKWFTCLPCHDLSWPGKKGVNHILGFGQSDQALKTHGLTDATV